MAIVLDKTGISLTFAIAEILIETYPEIKEEIMQKMRKYEYEYFYDGCDASVARDGALMRLENV
jgi:peptidoglycan/xylan/chitin deacetylase (PgdA/CDA1 family)